jgi:hypothetical protein
MGAVSVSGRSPVREAEVAEGWAGREIASGGKGRGKEKTVPVRKVTNELAGKRVCCFCLLAK